MIDIIPVGLGRGRRARFWSAVSAVKSRSDNRLRSTILGNRYGETTPAISLAISRKGSLERYRNDPTGSNESIAYAWSHCLRSKRSAVRIGPGVPILQQLRGIAPKGYPPQTPTNRSLKSSLGAHGPALRSCRHRRPSFRLRHAPFPESASCTRRSFRVSSAAAALGRPSANRTAEVLGESTPERLSKACFSRQSILGIMTPWVRPDQQSIMSVCL